MCVVITIRRKMSMTRIELTLLPSLRIQEMMLMSTEATHLPGWKTKDLVAEKIIEEILQHNWKVKASIISNLWMITLERERFVTLTTWQILMALLAQMIPIIQQIQLLLTKELAKLKRVKRRKGNHFKSKSWTIRKIKKNLKRSHRLPSPVQRYQELSPNLSASQ